MEIKLRIKNHIHPQAISVKDLNKMKIKIILFTILIFSFSGCATMVPHQNTDKLHASYKDKIAIDDSSIEVSEIISFKPGLTRFSFPTGSYKPIENQKGYIYYMSPYGTFVETIGSAYYVEGGIKLNVETGDLKFISLMGSLPVGDQNLNDYPERIVFKKENN